MKKKATKPNVPVKAMLTTAQAAEYIGVSASWLNQARCKGAKVLANGRKRSIAPSFYKLTDRKIVYKITELDEWLMQFRVQA